MNVIGGAMHTHCPQCPVVCTCVCVDVNVCARCLAIVHTCEYNCYYPILKVNNQFVR